MSVCKDGGKEWNTYPYWPWVFPFLPLSLFNTLVLLLISGLPPMSRKTTYTERACFCCHCTYPSHTHLPTNLFVYQSTYPTPTHLPLKVTYYENVFIHYSNSGSERVIWLDKRHSMSSAGVLIRASNIPRTVHQTGNQLSKSLRITAVTNLL